MFRMFFTHCNSVSSIEPVVGQLHISTVLIYGLKEQNIERTSYTDTRTINMKLLYMLINFIKMECATNIKVPFYERICSKKKRVTVFECEFLLKVPNFSLTSLLSSLFTWFRFSFLVFCYEIVKNSHEFHRIRK